MKYRKKKSLGIGCLLMQYLRNIQDTGEKDCIANKVIKAF